MFRPNTVDAQDCLSLCCLSISLEAENHDAQNVQHPIMRSFSEDRIVLEKPEALLVLRPRQYLNQVFSTAWLSACVPKSRAFLVCNKGCNAWDMRNSPYGSGVRAHPRGAWGTGEVAAIVFPYCWSRLHPHDGSLALALC